MNIITTLPRYKKGYVREDGMVFWGYYPRYKNGEYWITKEMNDRFLLNGRIYRKSKRQKDPKLARKLDRIYYSNNSIVKRKTAMASYCKHREARKVLMRKLYTSNPIKHYAANLKSKYGLSLEQYDNMAIAQNYCCAICNSSAIGSKKRLHIDHCHTTGNIRGLLCSKCNTALGLLNDNPTIMNQAIKYIAMHHRQEIAC